MSLSVFKSAANTIYKDNYGNIEAVIVRNRMEIETSAGVFVPSYSFNDQGRKKEAAVKFYKSGAIKSLPLEKKTEINSTIGNFSAELITFYQSGAIKRIFPLNGKISGFWTEKDEYNLAQTLKIKYSKGMISAKPIFIQFYESGELQSIAFWPDEVIEIVSPFGIINIRKSICFHRNGKIAGFEPLKPLKVMTPIGIIEVFDTDPDGMNPEKNAVLFNNDGTLKSIKTVESQIEISCLNSSGEKTVFCPEIIRSYCDISYYSIVPLKITFENNKVTFESNNNYLGAALQFQNMEISKFEPGKSISHEKMCNAS